MKHPMCLLTPCQPKLTTIFATLHLLKDNKAYSYIFRYICTSSSATSTIHPLNTHIPTHYSYKCPLSNGYHTISTRLHFKTFRHTEESHATTSSTQPFRIIYGHYLNAPTLKIHKHSSYKMANTWATN